MLKRHAAALAAAALLALAAGAAAAPPPPPSGSVRVQTVYADCQLVDGGQFAGRFVTRYISRVSVDWIARSERPGFFYLTKNIRIDYDQGAGRWRSLASRKSETVHFRQTPQYTTPAVRSVVGPTIATNTALRGRLVVRLKKVRPGPARTRRSGGSSRSCPSPARSIGAARSATDPRSAGVRAGGRPPRSGRAATRRARR